MSTDGVNVGRRRLLIGLTSAVGAVGVAGVAVPFVKSWSPSAKAKAAGAPVTAYIGQLEPGQKVVIEWRGKPVWVVRRTPAMLEGLKSVEGDLLDPASDGAPALLMLLSLVAMDRICGRRPPVARPSRESWR